MRIKIKTHDGREFEVKDGYVKINAYRHWADHLVRSELATYVEDPESQSLADVLERSFNDASWNEIAEVSINWLKEHGYVKHSEVMRVFYEWHIGKNPFIGTLKDKLYQLKERV